MASSTLPYIGSKISLISNSEIRYEGVLYTINTEESTVALQNVRSFGTEGRKFPDIPPTSDVYDFIIFRGQDIKDLTVSEAAKPIHNDPAIVSMNVAPPRANGNNNVVTTNGSNSNANASPVMNAFFSQQRESRQNLQPKSERGRVYSYGGSQRGGMQNNVGVGVGRMRGMQHGNGGNSNMGGAGYTRGGMIGGAGSVSHGGQRVGYNGRSSYGGGRTGGRGGVFKGSRHVIGELHPQPIPSLKDEMAPDFDFDEANAKFEKPGVNGPPPDPPVTSNGGENGAEQLPPPPLGGYNKKASFFDNISCETLDRQQGREEKLNREKQRALDAETFGAIAAQHRGSRMGGFRRGRRGGGRGRGGGGYMNYAGVRVGGYGEKGGMYNSGYAGNIPGGNSYGGRYAGY